MGEEWGPGEELIGHENANVREGKERQNKRIMVMGMFLYICLPAICLCMTQ